MFTGARKKITGNGLAAGCQLFYRKIYGYFLQCMHKVLKCVQFSLAGSLRPMLCRVHYSAVGPLGSSSSFMSDFTMP